MLLTGIAIASSGLAEEQQPATESAEEEPLTAEDLYRRAVDHVKDNDFKSAIADCSAAIELDPENVDYLVTRAGLFSDMRQLNEASADCTRILELDVNNVGARLVRARNHELSGDFDKAFLDLNECIERNPASSDAYKARRGFFARQGRRDDAIADVDRMIQLHPEDSDGYLSRAEIHQGFAEDDQAIAYASKAIERDPENWLAFQIRGVSRGTSEFDEAIKDLDEALRLAPENATIYAGRASVYTEAGEFEKAFADMRHAIALDPTDYGVAADLAQLLAICPEDNLRDGKEAAQIIAEALAKSPNQPEMWQTCALVAAENGDFKEAIRWQEKYLHSNTITPLERKTGEERLGLYRKRKPYRAMLPWIKAALRLDDLGQGDKAIEIVSKVLTLEPTNLDALRVRAQIYNGLDHYDKAIADLNELLRLHPDDAEAYADRALSYTKNCRCDLAVKDTTHAIALSPKDAWPYLIRGRAYALQKQNDLALADFATVVALDPKRAYAYTSRAKCYARKHEYDKALTDYNKAIELDPRNPEHHVTRAAFFRNRGEYEKALADLAQAEYAPAKSYVYSSLAWLFATCPDEKYRDAGKAAEYMDAALELMPNDPTLWATCGAVFAALEEFDDAIVWEEAFRETLHSCPLYQEDSDRRLKAYRSHQPYRETPDYIDNQVSASTTPAPPEK